MGAAGEGLIITGWRIGYCVAAPKWAQLIGAMNDLIYVCAPAPLQYGVAKGIQELPASFYDELARDYQRKRDQFRLSLTKAGLPPSVPEGAYYVLADVSGLPVRRERNEPCIFSIRPALPGSQGKRSLPVRTVTDLPGFVLPRLTRLLTMPAGVSNDFSDKGFSLAHPLGL